MSQAPVKQSPWAVHVMRDGQCIVCGETQEWLDANPNPAWRVVQYEEDGDD